MTRAHEADILAMEDLLEALAAKGYTYDEVMDLVEFGIDELGFWDDELEDDDGSDGY